MKIESDLHHHNVDTILAACFWVKTDTCVMKDKGCQKSRYRVRHFLETDLPSEWEMTNQTAFFPLFWREAVNLYIYFDKILVFTSNAHAYSRAHGLGNETVLIAPDTTLTPPDFRQMHVDLGMSSLYELHDILKRRGDQPLCFKQALFIQSSTIPVTKQVKLQTAAMVKTLSEKWRLSETKCPATKHVLILQRNTTRQIRNVDAIVTYLRAHLNTSVQVEQFEGKLANEQARIVHCANVFIAVQGAGMNWYKFLPPNARMLEITYGIGWPSRYAERARAQRPDVISRIVECRMLTPPEVFLTYAREWLPGFENATYDSISGAAKRKLYKISAKQSPISKRAVHKNSDCECDPSAIYRAVTS